MKSVKTNEFEKGKKEKVFDGEKYQIKREKSFK